MYGIILYNSFGIGNDFKNGIAEYALANVFMIPKKNAAIKIWISNLRHQTRRIKNPANADGDEGKQNIS